jgi:hypothetical protein
MPPQAHRPDDNRRASVSGSGRCVSGAANPAESLGAALCRPMRYGAL